MANSRGSLTAAILTELSEGSFRSAAQLASALNVSRSAIVEALEDSASLPVFRVRGRGYRIAFPFVPLSAEAIRLALLPSILAEHVNVIDEVESTNTELLTQAARGAPHGTSIFAEHQSGGRGRRGRSWQARWGEGLLFSLLWRSERGAAALAGLSLAVGVALARGLAEFADIKAELKWPNDLLLDGAKLGGVLVELTGEINGACAAVIGVGINLRKPRELPAADLADLGLRRIDRNHLAGLLLRHLEEALETFDRRGFAAFRDEWIARHAYNNDILMVTTPNEQVHGRFAGLADDGGLLLDRGSRIERFAVGEVSLRREPREHR